MKYECEPVFFSTQTQNVHSSVPDMKFMMPFYFPASVYLNY